jgi:hypothetical protein
MINQADKPNSGEGVYTSVSDPTRRGAEAATPSKDWTIQRPAPEKVQSPPLEPLSKMLMDHLKSLWSASAGAVQVQQHVKNQVDATQASSHSAPGVIATEVFTYSPTKINRPGKTQT